METVCGSKVKQIELEKRMSALKVRFNVTVITERSHRSTGTRLLDNQHTGLLRTVVLWTPTLPVFHLRVNQSAGTADVLTLKVLN